MHAIRNLISAALCLPLLLVCPDVQGQTAEFEGMVLKEDEQGFRRLEGAQVYISLMRGAQYKTERPTDSEGRFVLYRQQISQADLKAMEAGLIAEYRITIFDREGWIVFSDTASRSLADPSPDRQRKAIQIRILRKKMQVFDLYINPPFPDSLTAVLQTNDPDRQYEERIIVNGACMFELPGPDPKTSIKRLIIKHPRYQYRPIENPFIDGNTRRIEDLNALRYAPPPINITSPKAGQTLRRKKKVELNWERPDRLLDASVIVAIRNVNDANSLGYQLLDTLRADELRTTVSLKGFEPTDVNHSYKLELLDESYSVRGSVPIIIRSSRREIIAGISAASLAGAGLYLLYRRTRPPEGLPKPPCSPDDPDCN